MIEDISKLLEIVDGLKVNSFRLKVHVPVNNNDTLKRIEAICETFDFNCKTYNPVGTIIIYR